MPFIVSHITKVITYYVLYEASQLAYTEWLYPQSTYTGESLWLFAAFLFWEYFSMIYLRAAATIYLFPRVVFLLFLLFHFYYYSFPSGFHMLGITVLVLYLSALMIYCVIQYEVKAYRRRLVNIDQTR